MECISLQYQERITLIKRSSSDYYPEMLGKENTKVRREDSV